MMVSLETVIESAAAWVWGLPLVTLTTIAGVYFLLRSKGVPFRHFPHALTVLSGRQDKEADPGEISHFQALSVALAATIGMGNIAGVAVAIQVGGPGVVFWMWVAAVIGMATKYFTCSLAVMYRGRDSYGNIQGGPMYVIVEGLGRRWRPLAVVFCLAGLFGCLPIFNANQLTQAVHNLVFYQAIPLTDGSYEFVIGSVLCGITAFVVFGGLKRVGHAAVRLVPFMVVVYFVAVTGILILRADAVPHYLLLIVTDAFTADFYQGEALWGGALGGLIVLGVRRAAFSNEAGIGTAPMAHGAAKTSEPVHEGLVAMLGPAIDTLVVCTLTALAILVTGAWQTSSAGGVTLTAHAFELAYPGVGQYLLLVCVLSFGLSSLFSYSYFGGKCASFLFGVNAIRIYQVFYVASILVGAIASMTLIVSFVDLMFALMAVPTIVSAILLAPQVVAETKRYFSKPLALRPRPSSTNVRR